MKKIFKNLTWLMIPFMLLACSGRSDVSEPTNESKEPDQSEPAKSSEEQQASSKEEQQSSSQPKSISEHDHMWSTS